MTWLHIKFWVFVFVLNQTHLHAQTYRNPSKSWTRTEQILDPSLSPSFSLLPSLPLCHHILFKLKVENHLLSYENTPQRQELLLSEVLLLVVGSSSFHAALQLLLVWTGEDLPLSQGAETLWISALVVFHILSMEHQGNIHAYEIFQKFLIEVIWTCYLKSGS